ncbi:MAG TPA: ATP-binding protein, partial [Patescibacteria group bacterium]|nr:ATP-binding protein [Patescibacteria group bacterium]
MSKEKKAKDTTYSATSIQVLEGLDPVRKRPGMYIGGTSIEGLHHLVREVADNAIDEALAGHCTEFSVTLLPGNVVRVEDNGRGIPVEKHPQTKKSALETVMTTLHAGGKFGGGGYKVSGGLHGVGVSVVNALSEWLTAEVHRDGKVWKQEYKRGEPAGAVKPIGTSQRTGTTVTFKPDGTIFPDTTFRFETIVDHLRKQAYLTKGIRISITDLRDVASDAEAYKARRCVFYFDAGIVSFVKFLNRGKDVKNIVPVYVNKQDGDVNVEVSIQYTDSYKEHLFAFANNIHNPEGGMHVAGFRTALTRVLNTYARKNNLLREKDEPLTADDVREGLTAVINVKLPNPQFEGQTKAKLGNSEIRGIVASATAEGLEEYLEKNPQDAKAVLEKCILTVRARLAARAAKDAVLRKGALEGMTLPGKLADCTTRDASRSEVYIVE